MYEWLYSAELKLETHLFDEANSINSKIKWTKKVREKTHKGADLVSQPWNNGATPFVSLTWYVHDAYILADSLQKPPNEKEPTAYIYIAVEKQREV